MEVRLILLASLRSRIPSSMVLYCHKQASQKLKGKEPRWAILAQTTTKGPGPRTKTRRRPCPFRTPRWSRSTSKPLSKKHRKPPMSWKPLHNSTARVRRTTRDVLGSRHLQTIHIFHPPRPTFPRSAFTPGQDMSRECPPFGLFLKLHIFCFLAEWTSKSRSGRSSGSTATCGRIQVTPRPFATLRLPTMGSTSSAAATTARPVCGTLRRGR
mmetsp:Transcript_7960/g.20069  ORF Transcript_7960/g.20069 Transcript_7960/m.20069 type:complete len:212 (+) Transcript_7960:326-961(+)